MATNIKKSGYFVSGRPKNRGSIPGRRNWFRSSPKLPDRLWAHPPPYSKGNAGDCIGSTSKAGRAWGWPLTSTSCWLEEWVKLRVPSGRAEKTWRRYCKFYSYLLTLCSRDLLEKLTGLQLVKKFPAFYSTRRFITAVTTARHLSLSWASSIQSIFPHPTSWRSNLTLSSHLRLGLTSGLFPSGFPTKTLYMLSPPYMRYMPRPSHFLSILSPAQYWVSGFGGLGVACWPLVPKFAGSNPAEAVGFLRAKKSSARLPSEGK